MAGTWDNPLVELNDNFWNVSAWNSVCKDCEGEGEEELGERQQQQSVPSKYNVIIHPLFYHTLRLGFSVVFTIT